MPLEPTFELQQAAQWIVDAQKKLHRLKDLKARGVDWRFLNPRIGSQEEYVRNLQNHLRKLQGRPAIKGPSLRFPRVPTRPHIPQTTPAHIPQTTPAHIPQTTPAHIPETTPGTPPGSAASQPPRPVRTGPRFGVTGVAITVGALIAITLIGIWAITSQDKVLDEAAALPDAPDPEYVWIGPEPADACEEDVALTHGLSWTGQGWRAPLTLPEPELGTRTEGAAYESYLEEVLDWSLAIQGRVDAAVGEMAQQCGESSSPLGTYDYWHGTWRGGFVHGDSFPVATAVRLTIDEGGLSGGGYVETNIDGTCITGVVVFDHDHSTSPWDELFVAPWGGDGLMQIQGTVASWGWTGGGCPDLLDHPTPDSELRISNWEFSAVDFQLVIVPGAVEFTGYLALGSHAAANVFDFEEFVVRR